MKAVRLIRLLVLPTLLASLMVGCSPKEDADPRYQEFTRLANEGRVAEALELGDRLFAAMAAEGPTDEIFALVTRRLETAQHVNAIVAQGAKPNPAELLEGFTEIDSLGPLPVLPQNSAPPALRPSAISLYWNEVPTFSEEMVSPDLSAQEKAFIRRYYDLRMQELIVKGGRQVTVLDPNSSENVCYALVLPLLYLNGRDNDWNELKSFLRLLSSEMLAVASEFALLQAERPQAALALAQYRANATEQTFSPADWAWNAADTCVSNQRPDLADKLLGSIVVGAENHDGAAQLRLKIADGYARCGDCAMAAQQCESILSDLPRTSLYGKVLATYLGYLARDEGAEQVIKATATVLDDPRCAPYLAQCLYLRWWALNKTDRRDEAAQIAQRLMERYPDNPCVAPVLLERATDALAHQHYDDCRKLLTTLTANFPDTESAQRAQDILVRLTNNKIK